MCDYRLMFGDALQCTFMTSHNMSLYPVRAAPQDAYLGVPTSMQGSVMIIMSAIQGMKCVWWKKEGKTRAVWTWARRKKILIGRDTSLYTHTQAREHTQTHTFKYFGQKWTIAQLKLTDQAGLKQTASSNSLCKKCQQSFSEGHGVCYAQ